MCGHWRWITWTDGRSGATGTGGKRQVVFNFLVFFFVTPIFARIQRLNRRSDFDAVWFIRHQPKLLHSYREII